MIDKKLFGTLPDNREVYQYTLTNKSGNSVKIITFGAAVTSLMMPDRNGVLENLVLNYDSLSGYVNDRCYIGAIAGRYGNRIGKGQFQLEGTRFQLSINDGNNHLHGGKTGFNKKLWDATIVDAGDEPSLALTLVSPDQEEGYPGTVALTVKYTLTGGNDLRIEYTGTTDRTTILNPTHHSYFNLTGSFANTILDHELTIDADSITMVDHELIPNGRRYDIHRTPLDFRTPKAVGLQINEQDPQLLMGKGYDHNWILKNYDGRVRKVAEVYEPRSGRRMTVLTDQPGLQFYSGNFLNGTMRGKDGVVYQSRSGLCLEAQCPPDSPNRPEFPSVVLKANETYHQTTTYRFSIK